MTTRIGRDGLEIEPMCTECGKRKAPLGRSVPDVSAPSYCHPMECDGYYQRPDVSSYFSEDEPEL